MKERTETAVEEKRHIDEKRSYSSPAIEEHEPLEKSTAYVYYYYIF